MSKPIENYGLLSDCHSAALVGKDGSIDWLAFPSFDSPPCFAALLGKETNGRWMIAPEGQYEVERKYVDGTMVLETTFHTSKGSCKLTDCMLKEDDAPTIVRTVEGIRGSVDMLLELIIRFNYGSIVPWVRRNEGATGIHAIGGPEGLVIYSPVSLTGTPDLKTKANFTVGAGEKLSFTMCWYRSHLSMPEKLEDPEANVQRTIESWQSWSKKCKYRGFDQDCVHRSLIVLKALTYEPTGAIVAAPTTSLPETLGGERNWDYRYSWLRDSSFALFALLKAGYREEALLWNQWLLRAVAGTPSQVHIMYGIRGERHLPEIEIPWLDGYEGSRPVRVGNEAYKQFQLDVYGEVFATSHLGRLNGIPIGDNTWRIEKAMASFVCDNWNEPDEGIWEVRGPRRHFTHSKLMAWVALKNAIIAVKRFGMKGDVEKWEEIRDKIHRDICENGFDRKLNSFVQSYGSRELDASLLVMAHEGFLPYTDPRLIGTIEAIQKNLVEDGFVLRYRPQEKIDGLRGEEGTFLACSFWLVDALRMIGRMDEATEFYQRVQGVKNDLGLFAEEYSPKHKRLVGNFPQAFSHIGQVVSAMGLQESRIEDEEAA